VRIAALALFVAMGGCRASSPPPKSEQASTPEASSSSTTNAMAPRETAPSVGGPVASGAAAPNAPLRSCRVMKLVGPAVLRSSSPPPVRAWRTLAFGDLVAGDTVKLVQEATLTVQSTTSGREIELRGPGLAEICPDGNEEVYLSWGNLRGFMGPGVRPGADVWIATPLGVVRFNDANVEVDVASPAATRITVRVSAGRAVFVPFLVGDARDGGQGNSGEVTIAAGVPFSRERPAGSVSRWAKALAASCARHADQVAQSARAMLESDAGSLGEQAATHVQARRLARGLCAATRAAAALDEAGVERPFFADLERADEKWKGLGQLAH
jgi:hypothetical protein